MATAGGLQALGVQDLPLVIASTGPLVNCSWCRMRRVYAGQMRFDVAAVPDLRLAIAALPLKLPCARPPRQRRLASQVDNVLSCATEWCTLTRTKHNTQSVPILLLQPLPR